MCSVSAFPQRGDHPGFGSPPPSAIARPYVVRSAHDLLPLPGAKVLQEHGPPDFLFPSTNAWPGMLTRTGQGMALALGGQLRVRYGDHSFLPKAWDPEAVYLRSSLYGRTVGTLKGVAAGLFPELGQEHSGGHGGARGDGTGDVSHRGVHTGPHVHKHGPTAHVHHHDAVPVDPVHIHSMEYPGDWIYPIIGACKRLREEHNKGSVCPASVGSGVCCCVTV
jgi:hypothetical protein